MVVPVALIAERHVITRLLAADAVSAERAQTLHGLRWSQQRRLKRLLHEGVVRESRPGHYYVSAPDLAHHLSARRHRIAVSMLIVIAVFALVIYLSRL
jgi:hypothetical protein